MAKTVRQTSTTKNNFATSSAPIPLLKKFPHTHPNASSSSQYGLMISNIPSPPRGTDSPDPLTLSHGPTNPIQSKKVSTMQHEDSADSKLVENDIVVFDVGGQVFKTFRSTLTAKQDCLLTKLADPDSKFKQHYTKDGEHVIFVDRDPTHFRYILNFLRLGESLVLPSEPDALTELSTEADYYFLSELVRLVTVRRLRLTVLKLDLSSSRTDNITATPMELFDFWTATGDDFPVKRILNDTDGRKFVNVFNPDHKLAVQCGTCGNSYTRHSVSGEARSFMRRGCIDHDFYCPVNLSDYKITFKA